MSIDNKVGGYKVYCIECSKDKPQEEGGYETFIVRRSTMLFSDYESGYDGDYGSVYDQNFVFYDEYEDEEFEIEIDEEISNDDLILEEIPFVYCPSLGELFEA